MQLARELYEKDVDGFLLIIVTYIIMLRERIFLMVLQSSCSTS